MDIEEIIERVENREIVTFKKLSELTSMDRTDLEEIIEENHLKIYDAENHKWFNEDAEGHC